MSYIINKPDRNTPSGSSSMMPVSGYIESLDDLQKVINEVRERRFLEHINGLFFRDEFFRGQANSSWSVIPSLARNLQSADQVERAEQLVMDTFKTEVAKHRCQHRLCLPAHEKQFTHDWYWLFQAQHYEVPTRLLDWTMQERVALWFAVSDPSQDHVSGQFLVLYYPNNKTKIDNSTPDRNYHLVSPSQVDNLWMMNPAFHSDDNYLDQIAERRRARQYGKFVVQPYSSSFIGLDVCDPRNPLLASWSDTAGWNVPVLEKYIIPAHSKAHLRLALATAGITEESMYVEVDPVVRTIKEKCRTALDNFKLKSAVITHC